MNRPRLRSGPRFARQQRGYALLAASLGVVLFSFVVLMGVREDQRRLFYRQATAEGAQAAQFAAGIRGLMARVQAEPSLMPGGVATGVAWLKAPSCGGLSSNPPEGYVPCSYHGGIFGNDYRTTFTRDPATNFIEARTTFVIPLLANAPERKILYADTLVSGALSGQSAPNNGIFFNAFANVPVAANAPGNPASMSTASPDAGRVVMVASNAPSNDIHLRVDGTNQMLANLNMGGMSIGNARDARFTGDVRVDERMQIRNGLTVTDGAVDMRAGAVTTDLAMTSIGKFASQGIYDSQVLVGAAAYNVNKPDCSQAGGSPGIYAALQGSGTPNAAGYRGDALYDSRVDVYDYGWYWHVVPRVQTARFDLARDGLDIVLTKSISEYQPGNMRVLVMLRCR